MEYTGYSSDPEMIRVIREAVFEETDSDELKIAKIRDFRYAMDKIESEIAIRSDANRFEYEAVVTVKSFGKQGAHPDVLKARLRSVMGMTAKEVDVALEKLRRAGRIELRSLHLPGMRGQPSKRYYMEQIDYS